MNPNDIDKMISMYESGSTLKEVGAKFGVHRKMVSKILKDNGVQIIRRNNNFVTKDKLYDLYVNQELPSREIAEKLGTIGYLKTLVRTKVGNYTIKDSTTITNFQNSWKSSKN